MSGGAAMTTRRGTGGPRTGWLRATALVAALAAAAPVLAVEPNEMLKDQKLEARARDLSRELRCMVCQNQSIDDSNAPLARDLRLLVRERLQAGDSDAQVLDFVVARYGEFVLLRPRFNWATALLWLAPFVMLLGGALALLLAFRRGRRSAGPAAPLTADEQRRLADLAAGERQPGNPA
jgi:cytochrome c-type biogenesis protein CcmH